MKRKYNFLITPLGGRNAGTEAFKGLKLTNIYNKIVATDITDFSYGKHVCRNFYLQPYASSSGYIKTIMKIVKKENIDIIIPGSDYELRALMNNWKKFREINVYLLINSPRVIDICMNKAKTMDFLKRNSFPFIKTRNLKIDKRNAVASFYELKNELACPFIVKPNFYSGGSNAISIIQDKHDWNNLVEGSLRGSKQALIVQEYIDAADEEYTVGVMSDMSGGVISSFALKRDLSSAASVVLREKRKARKGKNKMPLIISSGISQGIASDFPEIRRFCENVAVKLKSTGPLNFQCRKCNGKIFIFEINPRFSGTTSIRAILGHNDVHLIFHSIVKNVNLGQQKYKYASVVRGRDVVFKELDK